MTQLVDKIIEYESGELDNYDIINLFSELIKSGTAWKLQGSYGRTAAYLIDTGVISESGEILKEEIPQ